MIADISVDCEGTLTGKAPPGISVIIPAFNEERYLPATLASIQQAGQTYPAAIEIIVVDNDSSDQTAALATAYGAAVVTESIHNIGRVRNRGVSNAKQDILVFLDADTIVPPNFFQRIGEAMADPTCWGGAANVLHAPKSKMVRLYLASWRVLAKALGMVQGAAQFCRCSAFVALRGYDESQFMGEDVDFYWRLKRWARGRGGHVILLADVSVIPSARKFDQLSFGRILLVTNPLFIALFRRTQRAWRDWYAEPLR